MYNLPKLIGTWFTVSIVGVSSLAAEQRCTMVNTSMYDGLLTRVPFLSETLNSLKSAKNIQINGQDLTLAGRTKQVDASGKWTSFISIRCQRNNNDWSPCGEPNAKFSLSKVSENKITGSIHIPWEYGSMYPPLFSIEYSCKTSGKIAKQTSNTNPAKPSLAPQDNIRSAFNSYSLQKRKEIQLALKKDGFYRSSIDGLYGKGTRRAIEDFASQNGNSILNEQGVTKTLTSVLKRAVEEEPATTVNVTKSEPKVDSGMATSADCIENASACTPKQLCEVATENLGGKIIWRSDAEFAQHMKLIKEFGLDCGEVATACEVSPDKCSITDLCNVATLENNGRVEWNFNTLEHIALAKEYGLTCNVTK